MARENQITPTNPPTIRAVILDYGEVLCHQPTPEALGRMASIFKIDPKIFLSIYQPTRAPYDRGDLPPIEYWQQFAVQAGVKIDAKTIAHVRQLDMDQWSEINEPMVRWLEQIHAGGYKTAILSNMPVDMIAHMRKNFAWISHFDHQVFSAEARSAKPEPEIYQACIKALGMLPQETLFIDDREENLQQARTAGIRGIRYQSVEHLRGELRKLDFPILPQ
jgi:putative hydrolase of the HAD superfamily